jgi:hypothetical protein
MRDGSNRSRDLAPLTELCRELAKLGLDVGLSDAGPAVSVRKGLVGRKLWISVDTSGKSFVWRRDDYCQHDATDPAGAAAHVAAYIKTRDIGTDTDARQ